MGPLNSADRRSSFFLFLMFFIIAVGLITLTAFFGVDTPTVENKNLNQQIAIYQRQQASLQKFAAKLSETVNYLNTINNPGIQNATFIDSKISLDLDTLNKETALDQSAQSKMFSDIVNSLQTLQSDQKYIRDNGNNGKSASDLQQELRQVQKDLDDCRGDLAKAVPTK